MANLRQAWMGHVIQRHGSFCKHVEAQKETENAEERVMRLTQLPSSASWTIPDQPQLSLSHTGGKQYRDHILLRWVLLKNRPSDCRVRERVLQNRN